MEWWVWLAIAVGVCLLVSLVPWLLLTLTGSMLSRRGTFAGSALPRINQLVDTEREQAAFWPEAPRSGRYEEIDRSGIAHLTALREGVEQTNAQADSVAAYALPRLAPGRVLILGAWRPWVGAMNALRERRQLDTLLARTEETGARLLQAQTLAEDVPGRLLADLSGVRAEVRRLYALWEAEVQAGTRDIQAMGDGLALIDNAVGVAIESLKSGGTDNLPAIMQADQQLVMAVEAMHRSEQELADVRGQRLEMRQAVEKAEAGAQDVNALWKNLQTRGAQDPAVGVRINELADGLVRLRAIAAEGAPPAYVEAAGLGVGLDALITSISSQLSALDETMSRSANGVEQLTALLQQTEQALTEAADSEPYLVFDLSREAAREGSEIAAQARQSMALGTWHGYQTAATLSDQARERLETALEGIAGARERVRDMGVERPQCDDASRSGLREQAVDLAASWAEYERHWHPLRQQAHEFAIAQLDMADSAWSTLPADYVAQGALAQSQLPAVQETLQAVNRYCDLARQRLRALAEELSHIRSLRAQLEQGLASLEGELLPSLNALRDTMLPELADRYDAWLATYRAERASLDAPSQIDYERSAGPWLADTLGEARAILVAHDKDVAHYGKLLADADRRLQRAWQRLQKLEPQQLPLPDEDLDQLTADYESWQAMAEAEATNPAVLSNLVTRHAASLEQRMEGVRKQISEGRQALSALDRQFEQLSQALGKTRASLRSMQQDTQWRQIVWVLGTGEEAWERALALQATGRDAPSLELAVNEMRRAVNTGQEAHQVYSGTEQQLRSALDRLNREFRAVTSGLDRLQRRAGTLRQQYAADEPASGELAVLEEHIAATMSLVSMAQNAQSFDDALSHLREAQEVLARD